MVLVLYFGRIRKKKFEPGIAIIFTMYKLALNLKKTSQHLNHLNHNQDIGVDKNNEEDEVKPALHLGNIDSKV